MAQFPTTEDEVLGLAALVAEGLVQAAEDFPSPPVPTEQFQAKLAAYEQARSATALAETAFREHHAIKDEVLDDLIDSTKVNLKYAEFVARDRPGLLNQFGWGPRRRGSPLEAPGETRHIKVAAQGETWAVLRWKSPGEGGKPGFYRIERRLDGGEWEDVGTSTNPEQLMSQQPQGVDIEYRVIAVNKAGEGAPSAVAAVEL